MYDIYIYNILISYITVKIFQRISGGHISQLPIFKVKKNNLSLYKASLNRPEFISKLKKITLNLH